MCEVCQASYRQEHEWPDAGPLCEVCGRFTLDPEGWGSTDRDGRRICYHCFGRAAELHPCRVCVATGSW
jgi:hypothetical protein